MAASSSQTPTAQLATFQDLLLISEPDRFHEVLDGEVVRKLMPGGRHGLGQSAANAWLYSRFCRQPNGAARPGGWWIVSEVTVELARHQAVQPDLAGWMRSRLPEPPEGYPIRLRPDWIGEIMTDGDARRRDGLQKRRIYADAGVPFYWLIDMEQQQLTVLRLTDLGYEEVLSGRCGEVVRAMPFEAVELPVAVLFGADQE